MPERLKAILDKITAWWKKFNTKQRSVLISIVAVVIVALVILGVVISRPTQVELVEAQSASEASTIKGVLEDNNISYEVDSKLVFFVNKSDEVNAIMALGDNGIPAQAYSIDNVTDGSFSTTEADKQKKYQVYLEDKLKDHLEKQSYVNEASVDITMPDKDGTILKSKEEATAAVTLGLKDSITDDQAYAIARLVATALGNDTTKGITIIDKKANVLYSGGDSDTSAGLATSQLSYKQKLEEQVKNEVKKTLESSNIFSNIEVGMNLDIDFSKTETAQKNYTLPDGQTDTGLLDSESNYQSDATNGQAAVPGTDSNSDDTTYTTQDGTPSESSITDNDKKYLKPLDEGKITQQEAIKEAEGPFREFMYGQTQTKDIKLFVDISGDEYDDYDDVPFTTLVPAFILSELRTAFILGFLIYIPFIVIDMVVSSVLMSMGMMMLPPTTISMPFKVLLFILADGWDLVIGNLVKTFY